MAVGAGRRGVLPGQRETAIAIVIELNIGERGELVAAGAALGRDLRSKLIPVGIGMAVLAARALLPQIEQRQAEKLGALLAPELGTNGSRDATNEGRLLRMAAGAGHRLVSALERITGLLVVLELEPGGKKSIHGVAGLALTATSRVGFRELSLVSIWVTGTTSLKAQSPKFGALAGKRAVAALTGNILMQALKRKSGLVMQIFSAFRFTDLDPARGVVAGRAPRAEFALVRIAVTIMA